ncbi:hypothetical protein ACUSIJ_00985 [Pseudochelatococcus sp. B33]
MGGITPPFLDATPFFYLPKVPERVNAPPQSVGTPRAYERRNAVLANTVSPFASQTDTAQTVKQLVVDVPPSASVLVDGTGSTVVRAAGSGSPVSGLEGNDDNRMPPPPGVGADTVIKDAAVLPDPVPSAAARKATLLSASAFDGLRNLGYGGVAGIFSARTAEEAAGAVGWTNRLLDKVADAANDRLAKDSASLLGRFLNFVVSKLRDNSANSQEAAKTFFHAVHGKGRVEAFQALREMVRPEERHHFKLNVLEHDTGEWQLQMLAGDLELFKSGRLPAEHPARPQIEDAQRIAEVSNMLGGLNPPVDAEKELRLMQANGDIRAFQALRARLAPADQALAKVIETSDAAGWYYTLKVGGTEIFSSTALLDDTLTHADKSQLTGAGPLTEVQTETLHHKLENAVLATRISRRLFESPRDDGAVPDIGDLEAIERDVAKTLADKTTTWEKYAAIAEFVVARTSPGMCMSSKQHPDAVELKVEAGAAYTLLVDGQPMHTAIAGDDDMAHIAAATIRIDICGKLAARFISDGHTVDNFRQANIQCMSDDQAVRDFISANLNDATYSSDRFLRIEQPLDADGNVAAEFSAVFRSDDGSEKSITFANRMSSRNELRGGILKRMLDDKTEPYRHLADLTARGYMSATDSVLLYALMPVTGVIAEEALRLSELGIDTGKGSELLLATGKVAVGNGVTVGGMFPHSVGL